MNEFDDLTDLDDVFGPLRSTARSAELSQESATIDLMVKAHRTSEGKHMFTSRRARIATLVATGVLGFGGMAAASPRLGGNEPADVPVVEEQVEDAPVVEAPVEEPAAEPVVDEPAAEEPAADESLVEAPAVEPLVDDPETDFDESFCEEGNHGKTVSSVARGEYTLGESPAEVSVTDAAHSSCGKNYEVDDESDVDVESEVEVEVDDESEVEVDDEVDSERSAPKAERPSKSDRSAGKTANGSGNSNRDD